VQYLPQQFSFTTQALVKHIESNKKNSQVQQTNVTHLNVKINVSLINMSKKMLVDRNSHLMRRCNQPLGDTAFLDIK